MVTALVLLGVLAVGPIVFMKLVSLIKNEPVLPEVVPLVVTNEQMENMIADLNAKECHENVFEIEDLPEEKEDPIVKPVYFNPPDNPMRRAILEKIKKELGK